MLGRCAGVRCEVCLCPPAASLQGLPFGSASLLPLSALLSTPPPAFGALVYLNLSFCSLGDAHVAALCQGLAAAAAGPARRDPSQRSLSLPSEGARAASACLPRSASVASITDGCPPAPHHPLETLVLGGVRGLGERGMRALGEALRAPLCGLISLDLEACQVSCEGCVMQVSSEHT